MAHLFQRRQRRSDDGAFQRIEFNEDRGSVCDAACRRDGRLENYHFEAQYLTRVLR